MEQQNGYFYISRIDQEPAQVNYPDDYSGRFNPIIVDDDPNNVLVNEVQDISFTPVGFVRMKKNNGTAERLFLDIDD